MIYRALSILSIVLPSIFLSGCTTPIPVFDTSRLSPLEVRAMQTRVYERENTKDALKTVLNVLQDEGFLVDYGNTDLGILHGIKRIGETLDDAFAPAIAEFSGLSGSRKYGRIATIEATANLTEVPGGIRIRVNFQRQGIGGYYDTAGPITDAKAYQEFFSKIERGLFLQKQGL